MITDMDEDQSLDGMRVRSTPQITLRLEWSSHEESRGGIMGPPVGTRRLCRFSESIKKDARCIRLASFFAFQTWDRLHQSPCCYDPIGFKISLLFGPNGH